MIQSYEVNIVAKVIVTVANKPQGASFPVFNVAVCVLCLFGNDDIFHIDFEFDFEKFGLIFASSQKYVE